MKPKINFDTFLAIEQQLEIKLGTIQEVVKMEKSDKMLKLTVFFDDTDKRTVMTNIGNKVNPHDLMFVTLPFITNLEPAKIMGVESTAMIMVPTKNEVIDLHGASGSKLL